MFKLLGALILMMSASAYALTGTELEYHGYVRAGVGTNSQGGDQVCFRNPNSGSGTGEFRLGNECNNFGEFTLLGHHMKGGSKDAFFDSKITMAYSSHNGHDQYEDATTQIVESYLEGGRFNDSNLTYWVGKRYYRAHDVHIIDKYHTSNMNGNGVGIGGIKLLGGELKFAYMRKISSTITDNGALGATLYDVRLHGVTLSEKSTLKIWTGLAKAPEGQSRSTSKEYGAGTGLGLGASWIYKMDGGSNDFGIYYGKGILESLSFGYSPQEKGQSTSNQANRLRIYNHTTMTLGSRWGLQAIALMDKTDSGADRNSDGKWISLGVRPRYFFNDHYSIAAELGHSITELDSDVDANNVKVGKRTLTRMTIAPQVSINSQMFGRPVIRAFLTRTMWNDANKGSVVDGSNGSIYANAKSATNFGFQGELWF